MITSLVQGLYFDSGSLPATAGRTDAPSLPALVYCGGSLTTGFHVEHGSQTAGPVHFSPQIRYHSAPESSAGY